MVLHPVRHELRFFKRPRLAIDEKVLGRHRVNPNAAILPHPLHPYIIGGGGHHPVIDNQRVLNDLDVCIIQQQGEFLVRQPLVLLDYILLTLIPPDLETPHTRNQSVLERLVQECETRVRLLKYMVTVLRRLLGRLLILGPDRIEPHHIPSRRERPQQARQHPLDNIPHLGRDDGRSSSHLIPERVAEIIVERLLAPPL